MLREDTIDCRLDLRIIGNVASETEASASSRVRNLDRCGLRSCIIASADHDHRTARRKSFRQTATDAPGSAGDKHNLISNREQRVDYLVAAD